MFFVGVVSFDSDFYFSRLFSQAFLYHQWTIVWNFIGNNKTGGGSITIQIYTCSMLSSNIFLFRFKFWFIDRKWTVVRIRKVLRCSGEREEKLIFFFKRWINEYFLLWKWKMLLEKMDLVSPDKRVFTVLNRTLDIIKSMTNGLRKAQQFK